MRGLQRISINPFLYFYKLVLAKDNVSFAYFFVYLLLYVCGKQLMSYVAFILQALYVPPVVTMYVS